MEDTGKPKKIQDGYQAKRKGYQPTETPATEKPPQGGSGTVPAHSEKPSEQESGGKK